VNLKKDAADYGVDGMARHRDACLILSFKIINYIDKSASQSAKNSKKIKEKT